MIRHTPRKGQNDTHPFLWGAATAAHQVEGGNCNQWTEWEKVHAKELADTSREKWSHLEIWEDIAAAAEDPANYISGDAARHYEKYEEDFQFAKEMGLNAFRFSIEWSRVEPRAGEWDEREIKHYHQYILAMKKCGLTPLVSLFHFTIPEWFAEKGGFTRRENIDDFVRFASKMIREFANEIEFFMTINEPEVYAGDSYLMGNWPPQHRSTRERFAVLRNLARAHNKVFAYVRDEGMDVKVGLAKNSAYFRAADSRLSSKLAVRAATWQMDDYFLKKVARSCDFLGLNFYFSDDFYGFKRRNPNEKLNDLGWDMRPANIEFVLARLWRKYHIPLIVTENGLADMHDKYRAWWLRETLPALRRARERGVDLFGYLHWSLLDNFEWDKGFWPRFGLIEVDYKNGCVRHVRDSAWVYRNLIADFKAKEDVQGQKKSTRKKKQRAS